MSKATRKLLSRNRKKADKDGTTSTSANNADLYEEMEKVFAMSENDKFDFSRLTRDDPESQRKPQCYGEKEFDDSHRKKSYPHIHLPIKGPWSHSSRRANTSKKNDAAEEEESKEKQIDERVSEGIGGRFDETDDGDDHKTAALNDENGTEKATARKESLFYDDLSGDEPAVVAERIAFLKRDESPERKVQFSIGVVGKSSTSNDEKEVESHNNVYDHKTKRKHSKHRKKTRKHQVNGDPTKKTPKISDSEEPAREDESYDYVLQLKEFLRDDVTSHRIDCARDKRRFSMKSNSHAHGISTELRKQGTESSVVSSLPIKIQKRHFDRSPHEVFVQLDELVKVGDELEWKETARWIKYEEDVVEGADRWGRPHVAWLSFHSLLNLRRCLETGVVILDLVEKELPGVAFQVVNQMHIDQLIKEEEKGAVLSALLLKHRHVNDHERFRFIRRNTASYSSLQNLNDEQKFKNKPSVCSAMDFPVNARSMSYQMDGLKFTKDVSIDMKEETYTSSNEDLDRRFQREKEKILKKIPAGAEATTVLVGTVDFLQEPAIAFVRLAEGIILQAVTEVKMPVRFMFILLGPPKVGVDYREIGRSISTLMSNSDFKEKAYKANDRRDLLRAINDFLDYSIVLPPGNWERDALLSLSELRRKNEAIRNRRALNEAKLMASKAVVISEDEKKDDTPPHGDPLHRTRKCFGGMINDIKRRFPFYKSDFIEGFNFQCLSAAIFMYFAALSTAITFGGLFAKKTDHKIGISETLVSTSASGILFGLLSGQPLLIIGTTGPLLLFDESLYKFCLHAEIEYLAMRVYVGFWLLVIALLVASIEGSVFIKVFTRFTEEIFASLISLIYIFESVTNMISVFQKHPMLSLADYSSYEVSNHSSTSNGTAKNDGMSINQPNTALFCLILSLSTFFLAYYLRHFRNSKFLGRSVRRALGDFGVPIAIIVVGAMTRVAHDTYTEKLSVPEGLSPTQPGRGWISPFELPVWAIFAASFPAFLVYILLFMETHISELIIGKKERKLRKGNGFHLDIVLVCLSNVGCGIIGAPWVCAATVRSVAHVSALTVMSTTHAPGEKPHIIKVHEQRVSALVVACLVGLSVSMNGILQFLPMSVLFGVFLYMGISSMDGIQFFERLKLFLMPVKHHPQTAYVRKVPTVKMYLFTFIQLLCLGLLWFIKSSSLSLMFPFFLILMVPVRALLARVFTPSELAALDSDEPDAIDKEDDEPDFYAESLLPG